MNKQEFERQFEEWRATIKVSSDPSLFIRDDDPVAIRKLEEVTKMLEEAPLPEWLLKKMREAE